MQETKDKLRLKDQLCFPIYLCAKELTRKYSELLEEYNLTYTQYIVMMYFWEMKLSNVKEVSETLMLDPSTLTPLLKKLEAKGYLRRERSSADERNLSITLTEDGTALEEKVLRVHEKMCASIGIGSDEGKQLYELICRILTNLNRPQEE